ncbi:MAG: hypothetical protein R3185_01600, partial [Candidatus Thermoplasmatota archaeon]|nr:hypothetical protein [Candidatus Thermoplasmatota archaeon]
MSALLMPGGPFFSTQDDTPASEHALTDEQKEELELPENDLTLARELLLESAATRGLDVQPLPLPQPSAAKPLEHALRQWLFIQHGAQGDTYLEDALTQAQDVPQELHRPLAKLILTHAQATMLQREALDGLSADEKVRIQALAQNPAALADALDDPPGWLIEATGKVAMTKSVQAAVMLLDAAHETLPALRSMAPGTGLAQPASATDPAQVGELQTLLPVLTTAEPEDGLSFLHDTLTQLVGNDIGAAPAIPLTLQLAGIPGLQGDVPLPGTLPEDVDRELGRLFYAARMSAAAATIGGPETLAATHLMRVESMRAALPTLELWKGTIETLDLDTDAIAQPERMAGKALEKATRMPGPDASVAELMAYALDTPVPRPSAPAQAEDLLAAMAGVHDVLGVSLPAGWQGDVVTALSDLTPEQKAGLATLLTAWSKAHTLNQQALAKLTPAEIDRVQANQDLLVDLATGETLTPAQEAQATQLLGILGKVDMGLMGQAALTMASATDTALPMLATPQSSHTPTCDPSSPISDCENGLLVRTPGDLIIIGADGPSTIEVPMETFPAPALVLDFGGDDDYDGPIAGSFATPSLALDMGGADTFDAPESAQGAGFLAAALLVQEGGDTTYTLGIQGQGASLGGVGALIDRGGDDAYRGTQFVQGAGLAAVATLIDTDGDDYYRSIVGTPAGAPGFFLDQGGSDTYDMEDAEGIPLNYPVDSEYGLDRIMHQRGDDALWLNGAGFGVPAAIGIDVDASQLDHDGDLWPSLIELLVASDAHDATKTPLTRAETIAGGMEDSDEDGAPNVVEEAAGTSPGNHSQTPAQAPASLPGELGPLAQLYQDLRTEYQEDPSENGLLVDARIPFAGRYSDDCLDAVLPFVFGVTIRGVPCAGFTAGEGDTAYQLGSEGEGSSLKGEGTIGLVAIGDLTDSTYELPYLLSLDLGGDDRYLEGAGGAALIETIGSENGEAAWTETLYVPLTHLDLAGNDLYLGGDFAHGAGGGLSVDLHGDDRYDGGDDTQGSNGGILLDDGGNDTYIAGDHSQASARPLVNATQKGLGINSDDYWHLLHTLLSARTTQPSMLVDTDGEDTYTAGEESQGYAV